MRSIPFSRIAPAASLACLASCASMGKAGKDSMAFMEETGNAAASKISELTYKIRPSQVPVVEVREKDLKKLPTGEERALAFEKSRRQRSWFFGGPVDFKEPNLPEAGGGMDGGLLPPKD